MTAPTKEQRLAHANAVIEEISKVGRRFFWSERHQEVARFEIDGAERVSIYDEQSRKRVLITADGRWPDFTHGGTMRRLVEALAGYIRHDKPISPRHFGPWPDWICDGDLWGYGDAMPALRATLAASPAVAKPATPTAAQEG